MVGLASNDLLSQIISDTANALNLSPPFGVDGLQSEAQRIDRRNDDVGPVFGHAEQLGSFSNDVLGHLASDGRVRPAVKGAKAAPKAPPVATTAKA